MILPILALALQLGTPAPRTPPPGPPPVSDPYFTMAFDPAAPAMAAVDNALTAARHSGKQVLLIMGANRCHDSAYLANKIDSPRFVGPVNARYHVVFVDVGMPQLGQGRNLDVAARFGFKTIKGTPTVAILDADGHVLNRKAAPKWRNAASRSDDDIYKELID
ncbi:hypothetical protein ATE67_00155 [Sphingopyxis sp. H050]|jgi:hypothetical protein|uniref:thioredoxin family protein n=1 Tax=Sphingopyxis sp. H050 TaxID=1759072 RepID=UPI0007370193|nr:thioredoxin family protein [Sphingopyxis sp. H050]KTE22406.1 hypothetical protein ATE67_00155 [Sphingopyxis sp. H050]